MADFTITVSNSLNLFGPAPSNKWNAHLWGAFRWGEGTTDLQVDVVKLLGNALTIADSLTLQSAVFLTVSNSLSLSSNPSNEGLSDGAGYSYVFTGNVTNAENRVETSYSQGSAGAQSYAAGTPPSTNWS